MKIDVIVCLAACAVLVRGETASQVLDRVSKGVDAGTAITNILSTQSFSTSLAGIATKISPFLGAIGPAISLVTVFLPRSPSPQMQYMKQKFAEMDAKFERISRQFGDVNNLIRESTLSSQYSSAISQISGLSNRLQQLLRASKYAQAGQKQTFIESYRSTYQNSAYNLYMGMISRSWVLKYNIPKTAMALTNNDRKKVQHIMKGVLNYIIKGVNVHLAYLKAVGRTHTYDSDKKLWETRITRLVNHIDSEDREIRDKYHSMSRTEILDLAKQYSWASHSSFADKVSNFLKERYFWRDWFVLVYDPIKGGEKHWVGVCNGHIMFRTHGRNIVVASVDKSKKPTDYSDSYRKLSGVSTYTDNWFFGRQPRQARDVFYNHLPWDMLHSCKYAGTAVIRRSYMTRALVAPPVIVDISQAYAATSGRSVKYTGSFYNLYSFG